MSIDQLCIDTVGPVWRRANALGRQSREDGKPCVCDLGKGFLSPSGVVLKVYRSAWEQGWTGWEIPKVFGRMEAIVDCYPLEQYDPHLL